jgi:flagellar biosynthesis GTPase FlhF
LEVKGVEKQRDNFQQKEAKLQQRWFKELLPRSDLMKTCAAVLTQNQGHPLQIMNPSLKATDPRPVPNKMDYMEVQPYLAEWLKVARGEREAREKDQRLITLRKEMEEEKKKALEAKDKELAHERSISQNLDASLKKVQSEVSLMEARIQTMENENKRLRSEAVAAEANFQKVLAEKKEELEQVLKQIVEKDREIVTLKQESIEIAERARLEKETLQMEIQKVKAQMRDVEMQLSQTVNALKQMKDSTLRAKREASGGVSPDKFALLIADLEEMRDRLAILTRESELERNTASWLKAKLGQNRRALELERQFLPLLHKVRGPVGPKSTMLEKKSSEEQRPATSLPAAGSKPLGNSLSAGSLGGRGSMA